MRDADASQIGMELMESDGIWGLDHVTTSIARRKTELRLDYARWSKNKGERRWVLVGDVERS